MLKLKSPNSNPNGQFPIHTGHSDSLGKQQPSNSQSCVENNHQWARNLKVELPMFDGEGVDEWEFKVHQYFDVYDVPVDSRIRMLSFHLSGPALIWYKWGVNNNITYTRETFPHALTLRFGSNLFHDHKAAHKELKQVSSIAEYQFHFLKLSNQVEEWHIALFIVSLQKHLKCELMMIKPGTYVEAVSWAKLHEQKLATMHQV